MAGVGTVAGIGGVGARTGAGTGALDCFGAAAAVGGAGAPALVVSGGLVGCTVMVAGVLTALWQATAGGTEELADVGLTGFPSGTPAVVATGLPLVLCFSVFVVAVVSALLVTAGGLDGSTVVVFVTGLAATVGFLGFR